MDRHKIKQNLILLTSEELKTLSKEELIEKYLLLQEQFVILTNRIEELERRIEMNSQNSSMPPSSDPPYLQLPQKKPTGRKIGGQLGHKGSFRQLLSIEKVNKVVVVKPSVCENCKQRLKGEDPMPHRHQVWEIPEIKPQVIEYQLHTLVCKGCGKYTEAELPEGVPSGSFGPRVQAIVAICTGIYHMSKRTVKGMMEDIFNLPIGLGSISACESTVSEALDKPAEEVKGYIQEQKVLHTDETGYKEKNQKMWLWTGVTKLATNFVIHVSRGQKAAQEFIGNFTGVLVSDRLSTYNIYQGMRQFCWAHLKRDFEGFTKYKGRVGNISEELLSKVDVLFYWWHRVRDGTLNLQTFKDNMKWLQMEVERVLLEGTSCGNKKMERFCKRILKQKDYLWTFVNIEGVEPTNNIAERALRPAVLWRKRSFGTQSTKGSEFVCRIMATGATCKQQGRNVVDYITSVCYASLVGRPVPSLLPESIKMLREVA